MWAPRRATSNLSPEPPHSIGRVALLTFAVLLDDLSAQVCLALEHDDRLGNDFDMAVGNKERQVPTRRHEPRVAHPAFALTSISTGKRVGEQPYGLKGKNDGSATGV